MPGAMSGLFLPPLATILRTNFKRGTTLLQYPSPSACTSRSFIAARISIANGVGSRRISSIRCMSGAALTPELRATLDTVVASHKVVLFMKGTKEFPQCGFSHAVVQILKSLNVPFETINILENEMLRQGLKEYSNWPTFPQLYIDGEFFGGCDIAVGGQQERDNNVPGPAATARGQEARDNDVHAAAWAHHLTGLLPVFKA
ncbi:hypothetical protein NMG60_11026796 [Bertholletia excelsa]